MQPAFLIEELASPKLAELITTADQGIVALQFERPEFAWDKIRKAHLLLQQLRKKLPKDLLLAHINLSTPFFQETPLLVSEVRLYDTLCRELNTQGWVCFSHLLDEDARQILVRLPLTATEEYRLEAFLKDFRIEVASFYLKSDSRHLDEVLEKLSSLDLGSPEAFKYEVQLIKHLQDLNSFLASQYEVMEQVEQNLLEVMDLHPELKSLYEKIFLYRRLLGDQVEMPDRVPLAWDQRILYLDLLIKKCGLLTFTVGNPSSPNFKTVAAFREALADLLGKHSFEPLFSMAAAWENREKDPLWQELKDLS